MRCTVTWHSSAEQELAEIWLGAQDREDVTEAANMIDQVLASEPLNH